STPANFGMVRPEPFFPPIRIIHPELPAWTSAGRQQPPPQSHCQGSTESGRDETARPASTSIGLPPVTSLTLPHPASSIAVSIAGEGASASWSRAGATTGLWVSVLARSSTPPAGTVTVSSGWHTTAAQADDDR